MNDELEEAWRVIAKAYGGPWDLSTSEWKEAAMEWRAGYHKLPYIKITEDDDDDE